MNDKKTIDNEIEGVVEVNIIGGEQTRTYIVKGDTVFDPIGVIGGERDIPIGFVKDGIAYKDVMGGDPVPIGKVKYNQKK